MSGPGDRFDPGQSFVILWACIFFLLCMISVSTTKVGYVLANLDSDASPGNLVCCFTAGRSNP